MRKKITGFAIGLAVIVILALIFFNFLEIRETARYIAPAREALVNEYLALDRWLLSQGYSVRTAITAGLETLEGSTERIIFIQSDLVDWNNKITAWLDDWVYKGGSLILCLDYYRRWQEDDPLGKYLEMIGLYYFEPSVVPYRLVFDPEAVSFSGNIIFDEPYSASLVLKDEDGNIRLAEVPMGRGKIIVTGRPRFLQSGYLDIESNARLSWYLFSRPDESERSVFFVRGERRPAGIFGRFFQHGNFLIIVIAAVILIIIGFWTALPLFGVARSDEKKGKPLAERFLAEARFLKRFGSLDVYLNLYFREIKRKLAGRDNPDDEEIIVRASVLSPDPDVTLVLKKAAGYDPGKKLNFLKSVKILKTILERI